MDSELKESVIDRLLEDKEEEVKTSYEFFVSKGIEEDSAAISALKENFSEDDLQEIISQEIGDRLCYTEDCEDIILEYGINSALEDFPEEHCAEDMARAIVENDIDSYDDLIKEASENLLEYGLKND